MPQKRKCNKHNLLLKFLILMSFKISTQLNRTGVYVLFEATVLPGYATEFLRRCQLCNSIPPALVIRPQL